MRILVGKKFNNKKIVTLRTVFVRYSSLFFAITVVLVSILILSFPILLSLNIILPANYVEKQIYENKDKIISSKQVTKDLI
ncbi:TPA: sensor histidine kinase, partial [Clostridioides difficile]